MSKYMLEINNLHISAGENQIIKGLNLRISKGEVHVLMGPNGAGKSTLGNAIMGHPYYNINEGSILFEGEDITDLSTDKRAKKGIFLSFQNSQEIPGITLENFLRTSRSALTDKPIKVFAFKKDMKEKMDELKIDEDYASRYLNVGFSGGEKKKSEILQLLMINPKFAILDETDSGLDVDAVKTVSEGVRQYAGNKNSLLIITHNTKILENLNIDFVHILIDGQIVKTGDSSLIDEINNYGFSQFTDLLMNREQE